MYDANEQWKRELEKSVAASEWRVKEHFDLVAENIRADFRRGFHDKLEQHEDRLRRLERAVG